MRGKDSRLLIIDLLISELVESNQVQSEIEIESTLRLCSKRQRGPAHITIRVNTMERRKFSSISERTSLLTDADRNASRHEDASSRRVSSVVDSEGIRCGQI